MCDACTALWMVCACALALVGIVWAAFADLDESTADWLCALSVSGATLSALLWVRFAQNQEAREARRQWFHAEQRPLLPRSASPSPPDFSHVDAQVPSGAPHRGASESCAICVVERCSCPAVSSLLVSALLLSSLRFCDLSDVTSVLDLSNATEWYVPSGDGFTLARCAHCATPGVFVNFEWSQKVALLPGLSYVGGAAPHENATSVVDVWFAQLRQGLPQQLQVRFQPSVGLCRAHLVLAGACLDVRFLDGDGQSQCRRRVLQPEAARRPLYDVSSLVDARTLWLEVTLLPGQECRLGFRAAYLRC